MTRDYQIRPVSPSTSINRLVTMLDFFLAAIAGPHSRPECEG